MKGLAVFMTSLFVTMSVSAQTGAETDSIAISAFDKYLNEIVIVAKKPGTIAKTDRKVYTVNQDLTSKASLWSVILPVMVCASNENTDTLTVDTLKCHEIKNPYRFRPTQLIIPGVLIGAGFIGLESDWLKYTNHETKEELQEHSHSKLGVDDFSQYAPLVAAYGLRRCGIKGLHDYVDLTIISGTAYLLTGLSVYGVKTLTRVERPDGSTRNSFPSGHTATAFAGAEILRREYWNVSPWIGVAGYAVAAGTGFFITLMAHKPQLGYLSAYIEGNFDGYKHQDFKLKKAYVTLNDFTIGYATSTMSDPAAQAPVIDGAGANGKVSRTNVLVRYLHTFKGKWSVGGSVEFPQAYVDEIPDQAKKCADYVPDIAAMAQYQWDGGLSHIRISGLLRGDAVSQSDKETQPQCGRLGSIAFRNVESVSSADAICFGFSRSGLCIVSGRYVD